jgi:hypothetical protein
MGAGIMRRIFYKKISVVDSGRNFVSVMPAIPILAYITSDDVLIDPNAPFKCKVVIHHNRVVKKYAEIATYDPESRATKTRLSARFCDPGHTFVIITNREDHLVKFYSHSPNNDRILAESADPMPSLDIPAEFAATTIEIEGICYGRSMLSNDEFRNRHVEQVEPMFISDKTVDISADRLSDLVRGATRNDQVVLFEIPLTESQLAHIDSRKEGLAEMGYQVRRHNCTQYPLAVLEAVLTESGFQKLQSNPESQPWTFYQTAHFKAVAEATTEVRCTDLSLAGQSEIAERLTSDKIEPPVQQYTLGRASILGVAPTYSSPPIMGSYNRPYQSSAMFNPEALCFEDEGEVYSDEDCCEFSLDLRAERLARDYR